MPEPEDLILEGIHLATVTAREVWRRGAAPTADTPALADVRQRLELFVAALYDRELPIVVAEPPPLPTWLERLARPTPRHLVERLPTPSTDGERIRLPRTLDLRYGAPTLATYQLLAVEQAARAARGTPHLVPPDADPLLRDLFLLAEAVAIERELAATLPGLLPDLLAARAAAHARRPSLDLLTLPERRLEVLLRAALTTHPAEATPIPVPATPDAALRWAAHAAYDLRALAGAYRGLPVVALWGRAQPPASLAAAVAPGPVEEPPARRPGGRFSLLRRRPKVREAGDDEDDDKAGMWLARIDTPEESVEDPHGLQRPADRDDHAAPEELADALAELPEARLVRTSGTPREVLASEDPPTIRAIQQQATLSAAGIVYPEWDYRSASYRARGSIVRPLTPSPGDTALAARVLARNAALVQQVRRQFDTLRPRRTRLGRQRDGTEIDLDACVAALADARAGQPVSDGLYVATRPARRDIAITLLVDISASTDSWVTGPRRIIDVEKEALLIVCEGLDRLGDRYAILAFSGEGPEAVGLLSIKGFGERNGAEVRGRIVALEPDRYTRMGAAIRHATTLLAREAAWHRLLLIISDGKPNDVDCYEGRYGIEDTRQAVAEARLQGLHTFCMTVDRQTPTYMPRIFGAGGYAVLRQPELLPRALADMVRRLMKP